MTNHKFIVGKLGIGMLLALASLALCPDASWGSTLIFKDTFDSESVGTFPSTWSVTALPPGGGTVVTNNVAAPSQPNAFRIGNLVSNQSFSVRRTFPTYSLNNTNRLEIGFRLNVLQIPQDGSSGFHFANALTGVGENQFASFRTYRGSAANTWLLQDTGAPIQNYVGMVTNNIPLNTWHDIRYLIDPSATNSQVGTYKMFFDGRLMYSTNYVVSSIARTNINELVFKNMFFPGTSPAMAFLIDDVYVMDVVPEPSSIALVGIGVVVLRGMRKRRRQNRQ